MAEGESGDHQPAMVRSSLPGAPVRATVIAGHSADLDTATALVGDTDPAVHAAALGALYRMGELGTGALTDAMADPDVVVRRRACVLAGRGLASGKASPEVIDALSAIVTSDDRHVGGGVRGMEPGRGRLALWSEGGRGTRARGGRGPTPIRCVAKRRWPPSAPSEPDHVGRHFLAALQDSAVVRRRATIALAAFDNPRVDEALRRCLEDRDWQVRQAAEDLLGTI